jgi:hypothetical protein
MAILTRNVQAMLMLAKLAGLTISTTQSKDHTVLPQIKRLKLKTDLTLKKASDQSSTLAIQLMTR